MRKYGKYEKRPEGVPTKQPKVKSALLQTYLTSLLCMVLCVTMFFGTSYAWFTSEVNNTGNEIYVGMLKAKLEKLVGDGSWVELNAQSVEKLYDRTICWEPGYTALETLKVVDKGDLAFNYELTFTDGTISGTTTATRQDVAKWFDVWVFDHQKNTTYTAPSVYAEISEKAGWTAVGTLAEVLNGKAVFSGGMNESDVVNGNPEHTYTIALHMNGENTSEDQQNELNALMGQKIDLSVKLIATQRSSETDGFGNADYDKTEEPGTTVQSVQELLDAIAAAAEGDVIGVAAGIYDFTANPIVINKSITLQAADPANKPELQFVTDNAENGTQSHKHGIEIKASNVTLKNLKLTVDPAKVSTGNLVQISANGSEYYSNILIDGCEFYGSDHCIAMFGNNVTIQNCILDESTADEQGNILYVWGTSGKLTVQKNTFIGNNQRKHGIEFLYHSSASAVSGEILIDGNTFENVYKGVVHPEEGAQTYYEGVKVVISNNVFTNCKKKPVAIDKGTFASYVVNGNVFKDIATPGDPLIDNRANAVVNANGNYWGSETPVWNTVVESANVTVENYYADEAKTDLRNK